MVAIVLTKDQNYFVASCPTESIENTDIIFWLPHVILVRTCNTIYGFYVTVVKWAISYCSIELLVGKDAYILKKWQSFFKNCSWKVSWINMGISIYMQWAGSSRVGETDRSTCTSSELPDVLWTLWTSKPCGQVTCWGVEPFYPASSHHCQWSRFQFVTAPFFEIVSFGMYVVFKN